MFKKKLGVNDGACSELVEPSVGEWVEVELKGKTIAGEPLELCYKVVAGEVSEYTDEGCTLHELSTGLFIRGQVPSWTVDGTELENAKAADVEGTLSLTDLKVPLFGESTIECSFVFHVEVGPGDQGLLLSVLSLTGVENEVICKGVKGACGTSAEAAILKPLNLPWETELTYDNAANIWDTLLGLAYSYTCKSSGLKDECTFVAVSSLMTSNAELGDVTGEFILSQQEETKELGSCTQGGTESFHIAGTGLAFLTGLEAGLTLTVQ